MNKSYVLLIGLLVMAIIINIILITNYKAKASEFGVGPVVQIILSIPLLIITAGLIYFCGNTSFFAGRSYLFLLIPAFLETLYFAYSKDLFTLFKPGDDGFLIRTYLYAIFSASGITLALGKLIGWLK